MVKTNIERLEGELNEVYNEFTLPCDYEINLTFNENCEQFNYIIECDNETKSYSYKVNFADEIEKKRYLKRYAKLSLYEYLSKKVRLQ